MSDLRVILGEAGNLGELLRAGALAREQGAWSEYESACNDLSPLQRAVLDQIAERALSKQPFAPFASQTLEALNRRLELAQHPANASKPNVQKALETLRERELIWRANQGEYALEDGAMAEWLVKHGR